MRALVFDWRQHGSHAGVIGNAGLVVYGAVVGFADHLGGPCKPVPQA
jgi:hypothetical protein